MRIFITIAELLVLMAVAIWLVTQPGSVSLEWGEYHMETSLAVTYLAIAAAFLVLAFVLKIWRFIILLPSRMYAYTQKLRPEKGLKALTQSVIAAALEEYDQARNEAYRFERYLGENPVQKALLGFSDLAEDKFDDARRVCETMKNADDAKTLSWIIEARIALRDGKESIALGALQSLSLLHDKSPWVIRELIKCSLKLGMYDVALETLKRAERLNVISAGAIKHCRAIIFYNQSENASLSLEQKENLLEGAHRLAPELASVAVKYSKTLRLLDKSKRAKKAIEQSWTVNPDHVLLEEYLAIDHETDPKAIMKTANALVAFNATHGNSYLAIAEFALRMQEWNRARAALHDFQEKHEMNQGACYLMARLELSQHADHARYREWMERALTISKSGQGDLGVEGVLRLI